MKFSEAFKVFQLNILKQSGVAVTPEQFGLKEDPIAKLQAANAGKSFSNVLGQVQNGGFGALPTPPTPPTDPTDATAQATYQQELLAYQQSMQAYNQRFMQMMLQQFTALQRSIQENQRQATQNTKEDKAIGTGGILGLFDS